MLATFRERTEEKDKISEFRIISFSADMKRTVFLIHLRIVNYISSMLVNTLGRKEKEK